ncbi:lysozyme inhibitor LprI family protein [Ovoidimarina sediminis]|uniref:lysozyme inhibitor LprI family protein n=1 Tax=Ovoidimarina sediminis TaxID=3079856 RepID=UPI002907A929|nr:lysozyme inhibitor LprI family protein [Rhodophyticola sp. MJ-SS7]MDU8946465.1 lysozyme inhibitor LprI family protein [Rhodophyticola sp. MJ-SS7]
MFFRTDGRHFRQPRSINGGGAMRTITLILVLALSVAKPVFSDPATECGGNSQVEIGTCVAETLQQVDATVDIYLGFAMGSAEELDTLTGRAMAVPALEAAQSTWSAYRDAHCDYVGATFGGGSGTGIGINSCRIELGRDRAEDLMRYVR